MKELEIKKKELEKKKLELQITKMEDEPKEQRISQIRAGIRLLKREIDALDVYQGIE